MLSSTSPVGSVGPQLIPHRVNSLTIQGSPSAAMAISLSPRRNCKSMNSMSGSYIGSVMSARNGGVPRTSLTLLQPPSPSTEKKLNRTRKMSEAIQTSDMAGGKTPRLMRIPTEVGDITKEFALLIVNQFLMKQDRDVLKGSQDIVDFVVKDCKSGAGGFSCTYKLDARIASKDEKGGHEQLSFIAKLLPANDNDRVLVFESNLLEKEIEVHFEVLPSLRQFLRAQKSGDQSALVDDSVPECVYGSHNLDGAGALVFRSCVERGFAHAPDPAGLSLDELLVAVRSVARIHAGFRAIVAKNSLEAVRKRYPYLTTDMYSNGMLTGEVIERMETYDDLLDSDEDAASVGARKAFRRLRKTDMLKGLRRQGPDSLNTIIHGELWEKNLLFHESDPTCKILDWKNAKIASATLDIAFLFFSSTNGYTIAKDSQRVLDAYLDSFRQTLALLEPVCAAPSMDELRRDFGLSARAALLQAICMFVQEMEFLERTSQESESDEVSAKLMVYERRAMDLLKDVEFLDDLEEDEQEGRQNGEREDESEI